MISEQEALDRLWSNKSVNSLSKVECDNLIKEIYKTLGRCKECKHYNVGFDNWNCNVSRDSKQALLTNIKVYDDWFCADFERKQDE